MLVRTYLRASRAGTDIHRYVLLGPRSTFAAGAVVRTGYIRSAGFLSFLPLLYPVYWGVSEGGNVISPTGEMMWYGILDSISSKYTDTGYCPGA
ncbi:hypothetical protein SCP_0407000 [Sparassis crispa]|uniref:Uncharacterized protein n=1 Tax=Sparassis crispa TaxID=139825 RepID=A0A401GJH3_9APHY|nr:hypothetical protein SCP_0407000 [Sparassis crispa]GBE82316.1 hypothetical protein SCP_0407000 [Sparassis crispa]